MSDFNRDGFADLAVGIPGESPGEDPKSGAVAVLLGSSEGLVASEVLDRGGLGLGENEADDLFGEDLEVGDFNNDEFDDLIIGVPGFNGEAGAIAVLTGSDEGLVASTLFERTSFNSESEGESLFGAELTIGDFNNDEFDDLIVGAPNSNAEAGAIALLLGSEEGLVPEEILDQETIGLGTNNADDLFGSALIVGDFDNDEFDDLVVGAPGSNSETGEITILSGSSDGLVAERVLNSEALDLGSNVIGTLLGGALTVGDFNNDEFDDLVVGAPGSNSDAGAIAVLLGSNEGLVLNRILDRATVGLGENVAGDLFGAALTVGDFNNDGFDDLIVGTPGSDSSAGAIVILRGSSEGLFTSRIVNQEDLGLESNEPGDLFGAALTVGDFNSDGFDDLAVGAPGESFDEASQAGALTILEGSRDGLVARSSLNQENLGIETNESEDFLGVSLVSGRSENDEDNQPAPDTTIELFRFRNTSFETGTYVFVGEAEKDAILADPNLNQTFALDGEQEDGTVNPAFKASTVPGENLIPFFRLKSLEVPGTFLFVSTAEYSAIFAEDSNQRDKWEQEGLNEAGADIPEFYLYDGAADRGIDFNRFQNLQNNTFLYAGPDETEAINNNPSLSNLFIDQGIAFESL